MYVCIGIQVIIITHMIVQLSALVTVVVPVILCIGIQVIIITHMIMQLSALVTGCFGHTMHRDISNYYNTHDRAGISTGNWLFRLYYA